MSSAEAEIMRYFRRFGVGAGKMLFFNTSPMRTNPDQFRHAMGSLIRQGLVVQEHRRDAYSLTDLGYRASLAAQS
jgi:hypothetical protein